MSDLVFTGERFLPELRGEIWLEHWHRYHFAAPLGENRRVLDVASGEGYGSAMLALAALSVTGLDASAGAVAHARTVYGHLSNLQFVCGDCAALPFADGSFDVVVSFETIEHIAAQREFLGEIRRVLAPDGMLLLSSPNKAEYIDRRGYENPFHVAELYRDELDALIAQFFSRTVWYGQGVGFCSTISAMRETATDGGELVGLAGSRDQEGTDTEGPKKPLYYLVGCANTPAPLAQLRRSFSVLGDPDDTVYRDYQDTYRKFVAASEAVTTFRERESRAAAEHARVRESAQADIEFALEQRRAAERHRETAMAEAGEFRDEAARARAEAEALKTLAARVGQSVHLAQQSSLRLTAALHESNTRHATDLTAAQATSAELTAALATERENLSREQARHASVETQLRRISALQAAEIDRRAGWRWRLRAPWRR